MPSFSHDVVIAGAGPVGLFLAGELALAGHSVLVLERVVDPASPLKALPLGLRGLSVPSVEALDRRGLLDALSARVAAPAVAGAAHWAGQRRTPGGHFAGIQFFMDQVDPAASPGRLPGPAGMLAADMASIEAVFAAQAEALGVEVRRGVAVEGLAQDDDGVTVDAGGGAIRARWLVGCDGGRSAVRKAAGIGFAGTEPELTGYSALVTLADPTALSPGRHVTEGGMVTFAPPGTLAMVEFDGGARHRSAPDRAAVAAVLARVAGRPVPLAALDVAATWTDRAYLADAYRAGRVLLAGDAAHVHSPLGGQGLNLGLGDAINLGWKLAATIRGDAPAGLLDSYAAERRPVAAAVLDWSRAQVALMRPDPGTQALRDVMRDLIATRDGATMMAERVSAAGLRHDLGGGHPLVGRSALDLALVDGSRVAERLRGGRGLLVERDGVARLTGDRRVDRVEADLGSLPGLAAMLVRPDGLVAWASDGDDDPATLAVALDRWFGARR